MATMTMNPATPVQGGTAELCYNPAPSQPVDVEILWIPPSLGTQTCTLTADQPCCEITIPEGADGYRCEDQSGQAEDISGFVDRP